MSKRWFITGGTPGGFGVAFAEAALETGDRVTLTSRRPHELATLADQYGERILVVPLELTDAAQVQRAVHAAEEHFGGIDVLVNNAGMNKRGPIERYAPEELAAVVQVNLTAPIVLTRLVLPYLRTRGRGAVVNVASIAGRVPVGHEAVYSATKFGLRAFTFAMQEELHGSGITISAVSPGPVETGFIMENLADVPDVVFAQPMSSAEDVAKLILDCAADGTPERVIPQVTGYLATAAYLFPALRDVMLPMMEKRGKQAKEEYRKKRSGGAA